MKLFRFLCCSVAVFIRYPRLQPPPSPTAGGGSFQTYKRKGRNDLVVRLMKPVVQVLKTHFGLCLRWGLKGKAANPATD